MEVSRSTFAKEICCNQANLHRVGARCKGAVGIDKATVEGCLLRMVCSTQYVKTTFDASESRGYK